MAGPVKYMTMHTDIPGAGKSTALVLGLGVSGEAASRLLLSEGARVYVVDAGGGPILRQRAERLRNQGARVALHEKDLEAWLRRGDHRPGGGSHPVDLAVVSPGIPADGSWAAPVVARGILLMSALELGASRCRPPILAVTGTNGKSTCVRFCGEVLQAAGYRCVLAGNYGRPLAAVALENEEVDWIVTEVSSFQLETVQEFTPQVGVLLNVQPDHLDRHGDMERYTALKARLFDRMGPGRPAVVHDEALAMVRARTRGRPDWRTFGLSPHAGYRYVDGAVRFRAGGRESSISLRGTLFENPVMGCTAAATLAALRAAGVKRPPIRRAAREFVPLPHRMQELPAMEGIRFVDDSKATNLAALGAALEQVDGPVRLIAGGLAKEKELDSAKEILAKTVRSVYLLGDSAKALEKAWKDAVPCRGCGTLDAAIHAAWRDAHRGEVVLLSPGCASFDQFSGYEERGMRFQGIVKSLRKGKDEQDED